MVLNQFDNWIGDSNGDSNELHVPEVETLVQEAEPSDKPLTTPTKMTKFKIKQQELPDTAYNIELLADVMDAPHLIRNIVLLGHLDSGKTTIMECLVRQSQSVMNNITDENPLRYTESLLTEQQREVSIKSSPVTLVFPDTKSKYYLMNIIDTPGHANFSHEVKAAIRMADSAVLVVDAAEGVMPYTERLLKYALQEKLALTVCINKIDRLILELKLPLQNAYYKLCHIIEEINSLIVRYSGSENPTLISPLAGNVAFASSKFNVFFTLKSFAMLHSIDKSSLGVSNFVKKFWGNVYLHRATKKFIRKPLHRMAQANGTNIKFCTFIQLILKPLFRMFAKAAGDINTFSVDVLDELGIQRILEDSKTNLRQPVSTKFWGNSGLVYMCIDHVPSPQVHAAMKVQHMYTGPIDSLLAQDMINCDPNGRLMVHTVKMYPSADNKFFVVLGRVMSGTLEAEQKVRVLGRAYSPADEEDTHVLTVRRLWMNEANCSIELSRVPAGNWVLIEGIYRPIVKTSTITDLNINENAYIFR